jgi:hypothetical protein
MLSVSPTTVVPGQRVTVIGRYWTADCNDVIVNGATPPPERPGAAHLVFVQDARAIHLADLVADAGALTFRTVVRLPRTARDGEATIETTGKVSAPGVALHVTGASTTPSKGQLPFTGARESPMIVLAALLICVGAALYGVGNWRPRHR